jgi:hypothetical protein
VGSAHTRELFEKSSTKNYQKSRIRGFLYKVLVNLFQKVAGFGAEPQGFDLN